MKYSSEDVKKIFNDAGCTLLSTEYKNNKTPMKYICNCGQENVISLYSFSMGRRCKECGKKKSIESRRVHTKESVQKYFENNGCTLLSTYKGYHDPLDYICKCGNSSKIRYADFLRGQRCMECKKTTLRSKFSYTYDEVFNMFKSNGNLLLSEEYINSEKKLKYICDCGNIDEKTLKKYLVGQRCQKCANKKTGEAQKRDFNEIRDFFTMKSCVLLETKVTYQGVNIPMNYICVCGNKSRISYSNFKKGQRCYECKLRRMSGENHPNWNPEITDEERKIKRNYPEYKQWILKVYKRDNFICQVCQTKGETLNAHHIYNYSEHKSLRTELSNGITLCEKCHKTFHKTYGYRKNNLQQLNEFLLKIN